MKVSLTAWIRRRHPRPGSCRRPVRTLARVGMVLPLTVIMLSVQGAFSAAGQQRPLTAADLGELKPQAVVPPGGLSQSTGSARTESLVLAPYDDTALRLALAVTGADFLKGTNAERLIGDAAAVRAEAMRQLLPEIQKARDAEAAREADAAWLMAPRPLQEASLAAGRSKGRLFTAPHVTLAPVRAEIAGRLMPAVASSAALRTGRPAAVHGTAPRQWPPAGHTSTAVAEYEVVADGMTANVREELSLIFETRQVGFRHVKRETVERNDDPAALGRYVVESGMIDARGSTVKALRPRRLKPTSTHRVTTETVREARVDRCPDAAGLTRGDTRASVSIRATSAATGNGGPLLMDITARGVSTGRVDDGATLTGFDWNVTAESRMESLGAGENFRLGNGMSMRVSSLPDGPPPSVTGLSVTVTGVGSREAAQKMHSAQGDVLSGAFGPLLHAYDYAEDTWRGGGCIALTAASGAEPARLPGGEPRRLVVEARHRYETEPPAVPVAGQGSRGTLTPGEPVQTPAAAFVFTPDSGGKGGGTVGFKSTSRRGIARDITVYFDEADVEAISIEYEYSGFAFVDSTAEDCPDMRPDGREILTARLQLVAVWDGSRRYEGTGRFSADIDGCGLTPNRKDPGRAQGNTGFGGFVGDNFLGCKVTTVVPERAVRVSLRVSRADDDSFGAVEIEWTPAGPAADARVTSPCEPPWHAEHVKSLTAKYRGPARVGITDPDVMPRMLDGAALRAGTYTDPNGSPEGTWTLTVAKPDGRSPEP